MNKLTTVSESSSVGETCLIELGATARHLEETVAELAAKLNPICRQEPESINDRSACAPQEIYSPYFDSMRDKTTAIQQSLNRLHQLLALLEI